MAGDWIKVEHATTDKPEVLRIAEMLGVSRRETIGLLIDFWVWLDRNSCNAGNVTFVTHMSRKSIDDVTHCPGFASCLIDVGWAEIDESSGKLTIPNGVRHNGKSAKTRALTNDRVKRIRNDAIVTKALPEKRREEGNSKPQKRVVDNSTSVDKSKPGDRSPKVNGGQWRTDPDAAARKGAEFGLKANRGESTAQFVARINAVREGRSS